MMTNPKALTTGQVAAYCQVSTVTVWKWIKSGKLKAYTLPGGHYRVRLDDLRSFLLAHGMPLDPPLFSEDLNLRILVVDDEPEVAYFIARVLHLDNSAYKLAVVSDVFAAGLQLMTFKPNLLILDLLMPGVDGFRICQRVRTTRELQHTKILVVTALTGRDTTERALALGADDFLNKPFQIEDLQFKVRTLLGEGVQ